MLHAAEQVSGANIDVDSIPHDSHQHKNGAGRPTLWLLEAGYRTGILSAAGVVNAIGKHGLMSLEQSLELVFAGMELQARARALAQLPDHTKEWLSQEFELLGREGALDHDTAAYFSGLIGGRRP